MKNFWRKIYKPPHVEYDGSDDFSCYSPMFNKLIVRFDVGNRKELRIYDVNWELLYKYDRYTEWEFGQLPSKEYYKRAQFRNIHIIGRDNNSLTTIYFPDDKGPILFDPSDELWDKFKRGQREY